MVNKKKNHHFFNPTGVEKMPHAQISMSLNILHDEMD